MHPRRPRSRFADFSAENGRVALLARCRAFGARPSIRINSGDMDIVSVAAAHFGLACHADTHTILCMHARLPAAVVLDNAGTTRR